MSTTKASDHGRLEAAQATSTALIKAAGHHPAAWHDFGPVRSFTHCVMRGCNLAFSLDLTGLFGRNQGTIPPCPYAVSVRRTWQLGDGQPERLALDGSE